MITQNKINQANRGDRGNLNNLAKWIMAIFKVRFAWAQQFLVLKLLVVNLICQYNIGNINLILWQQHDFFCFTPNFSRSLFDEGQSMLLSAYVSRKNTLLKSSCITLILHEKRLLKWSKVRILLTHYSVCPVRRRAGQNE